MDSDQNHLVSSLKKRIEMIVSMLEDSESEREVLRLEKNRLSEQVKMKTVALEKLEERYENLKLARAILGSGESSHDAKIKVNRIMREIDKCIALLNH